MSYLHLENPGPYTREYPGTGMMRTADEDADLRRWFDKFAPDAFTSFARDYERITIVALPWQSAGRSRLRNRIRYRVDFTEVKHDGSDGAVRRVFMEYTAPPPPTLFRKEKTRREPPAPAAPAPGRTTRLTYEGSPDDEDCMPYSYHRRKHEAMIHYAMHVPSRYLWAADEGRPYTPPPPEPRYRRNI